jgi:hypothetical protein
LFTDSPHELTVAEPEHCGHAIIEGRIADFKDSALAHLPSGVFEANHAWLIPAAIAHNPTPHRRGDRRERPRARPDRHHQGPTDPDPRTHRA